MSGSFVKGAVIGFVCALLGGATVALAGSGINGVFNLGVSNSVDAKTTLTGASPGIQLQVTNTNPAPGTSGLAVNSASGATTGVFTNTGGGSAGGFFVNAGVRPFTVNSNAKVGNLNADLVDGIDSTGFLRNKLPLALTGSVASTGVFTATNTGGANGVQGVSNGGGAGGVFGENSGGGYGVAGTSLQPNGVGVSGFGGGYGIVGRSDTPGGVGVFGTALGGGDAHAVSAVANGTGGAAMARNQGAGPALELHSTGAPITVDSSVKVANLNADQLDGIDSTQLVIGDYARGGRLIAIRQTQLVSGPLLIIPGLGGLFVDGCDNNSALLRFDALGTGNFDLQYSGLVANAAGEQAGRVGATISVLFSFGPWRSGFFTLNIARGTFDSTKIATIWVSWYAVGCRFQAQALVSPQL